MELVERKPSSKGPEKLFTGDVWLDPIVQGPGDTHTRVFTVRFSPGARTAWHSHVKGQTLHIVAGLGLVQSRGGEIVVARPGDVIYTPPGEWHWHGAAPDNFMVHTAIWEGTEDGCPESDWGDHVTESEYRMPEERVS